METISSFEFHRMLRNQQMYHIQAGHDLRFLERDAVTGAYRHVIVAAVKII